MSVLSGSRPASSNSLTIARLPLLDGDDQRRLAHPVGAVDLRAHPEQPFDGLVEADARSGDQRRVAALARQDSDQRLC